MLLQDESAVLSTLDETKQETITPEKMLEYWRGTTEFVESLAGEDKVSRIKHLSFPSSTVRRPKVCVAKKAVVDNKFQHLFVNNMQRVETMIQDIESFHIETNYTGADSDRVKMITGLLPSHYESRVAMIRLDHLPKEVDKDRNIFVVREKNDNDEWELSYYCTSVNPFYPDRHLVYAYSDKGQQMNDRTDVQHLRMYHRVHFKVSLYDEGENGVINSWDVGIHKETRNQFDGYDQFVMLGTP